MTAHGGHQAANHLESLSSQEGIGSGTDTQFGDRPAKAGAVRLFSMHLQTLAYKVERAMVAAASETFRRRIICRLHDPFADQLGFFPPSISAGGGSGCTCS